MTQPGRVESKILKRISKKGTTCAVLVDPEDFTADKAAAVSLVAQRAGADMILVGGSTVSDQRELDAVVMRIKKSVTCPVILFPGNITGVSQFADAILFSCLLNSTNPYFIIGAQALGSLKVYKSRLESIPMGYLVFGNASSTSFVGQTTGVPFDKPNIAVMYALAAMYLGMRSLYLEAGSGSTETIPPETIRAVRRYYSGLLIVGGGITSPERAREIARAGADVIVVGNLVRKPNFEETLSEIVKSIKHR